jgi:hypothetical protein
MRRWPGPFHLGQGGSGPWRAALEPDERALRLGERLGRLLRRDDASDLVVVPRRSGLARRLHLRQEEIMEQTAVLAHPALGKEVVHRRACICAATVTPSLVPAACIDFR